MLNQDLKMKIFCSITEYRSVNVKLEEVKAELRENRRFIRSVLQILQQQVNNASDPFELPQGVHLPLTSTAQLEDMNKRLQDDASYRKRLVSYDSSQRINTYCFLRVFEGRFLTQIKSNQIYCTTIKVQIVWQKKSTIYKNDIQKINLH